MSRFHVLLLAILLLSSALPIAAYAQGAPNIDGPTQTALNALRTNAAGMVASLSNNKGVSGDQLTASYDDKLTGMSSDQMNTVMIVKARAEQAAWNQMDPTSRALIKNYFALSHSSGPAPGAS
jgi:hypothetical protein